MTTSHFTRPTPNASRAPNEQQTSTSPLKAMLTRLAANAARATAVSFFALAACSAGVAAPTETVGSSEAELNARLRQQCLCPDGITTITCGGDVDCPAPPTAGTCSGAQGTACCTNGSSACASGLTCQNKVCEPPPPVCTGAVGATCCASGPACSTGLGCLSGVCQPTTCGTTSTSKCCTAQSGCGGAVDCYSGYCLQALTMLSVQSCEDASGNVTPVNGFQHFWSPVGTAAQQVQAVEAQATAQLGCVSTTPKPSCCLVAITVSYGGFEAASVSDP
ncbi:MAG: hypothetical protein ACHREM_10240 [Polyangiales bacterium]